MGDAVAVRRWTMRDVVAHLTVTTTMTVPRVLSAAVRARGSFDRMAVNLAAHRAATYSTAELTGQLRESALSGRDIDLLLAAAGRRSAVDVLEGPGTTIMDRRLLRRRRRFLGWRI